ncbi:hypothetical protein DFH09DRAFT_1082150 [Mycena vulgaris]|nr:hypothetical protein DFH09DRAFT_1082150 [Mycena vulgaris]
MLLLNKWELIEASGSLSHWHIRDLIAACPNLQPVGLGNNDTEIDTSILIPSHDDEDDRSSAPNDTTDLPDELTDTVIDLAGSDSDDSLLSTPTLAASVKGKREEDVKTLAPETKPPKKTKPQPPISIPAVPWLYAYGWPWVRTGGIAPFMGTGAAIDRLDRTIILVPISIWVKDTIRAQTILAWVISLSLIKLT